jgi:hypothetical protein
MRGPLAQSGMSPRRRAGPGLSTWVRAISLSLETNPDYANGSRIRATRLLHPGYDLRGGKTDR